LKRASLGTSTQEAAARRHANERMQEISDRYGVQVEGSIESVACAVIPVEVVECVCPDAGRIRLTVDVARGLVFPPQCHVCSRPVTAGVVSRGGIRCRDCGDRNQLLSGSVQKPGEPGDIVDRGEADMSVPWEPRSTILRFLAASTWQQFVEWLLKREGYSVQARREAAGLLIWECQKGADSVLATAYQAVNEQILDVELVERFVSVSVGVRTRSYILVTNALTGDLTQNAANRLNVTMLDAVWLDKYLSGLDDAYAASLDNSAREREERASAADSTSRAVKDVINSLDALLITCTNHRHATGRTALEHAVRSSQAAYQTLLQGITALETVSSEWLAGFGDKPAEDGSLKILITVEQCESIRSVAVHVGSVLGEALKRLAAIPGVGEHGYGSWRTALIEHLAARFTMIRSAFATIDIQQKDNFELAWSQIRNAEVDAAATAARHADSRVERHGTSSAREPACNGCDEDSD